jgi:hypothetical protein
MNDPIDIARRIAKAGYSNPAPAVLDGLGVSLRQYAAIWQEVNGEDSTEPPLRERLLSVAEEVTGSVHSRPQSALFTLTQAAFDKGDAEIPDSAIPAVVAILREATAAGWDEKGFAALAADRLDTRLVWQRYRTPTTGKDGPR